MAPIENQDRIAVVTGANKGIGWETARRLAEVAAMTVVLTARDHRRGAEATAKLHRLGLSNVVFHQLDVTDYHSINSFAHFIGEKFGRLDILVNNAGANGMEVNAEELRALNIDPDSWISGKAANLVQGVMKCTYDKAQECFNTNYFGSKRVTEALLPWLELSTIGARIVNVTSLRGELWRIPNDKIRTEFTNVESLTEERIQELLQKFLQDLKQNALTQNGWPVMLPAYGISKTALNAYTRLLARKYPKMYINCVHPGYVNTDLCWRTGPMSAEQGAEGPVKLALLPNGGPTGCYFNQTELAGF